AGPMAAFEGLSEPPSQNGNGSFQAMRIIGVNEIANENRLANPLAGKGGFNRLVQIGIHDIAALRLVGTSLRLATGPPPWQPLVSSPASERAERGRRTTPACKSDRQGTCPGKIPGP